MCRVLSCQDRRSGEHFCGGRIVITSTIVFDSGSCAPHIGACGPPIVLSSIGLRTRKSLSGPK